VLKLYAFLFIFGIIGGAIFGAKYYYDSTQATIQRLSAEKAILDTALEQQTASINAMQEQMERQNELNTELQANLQEANSGLNEMRSKFARHDLTRLAIAKPGLIQTRINNGTDEVFREIEENTNNKPVNTIEPVAEQL
jgi:chromosome segregation ATPase